jgi:hypothetical protein
MYFFWQIGVLLPKIWLQKTNKITEKGYKIITTCWLHRALANMHRGKLKMLMVSCIYHRKQNKTKKKKNKIKNKNHCTG